MEWRITSEWIGVNNQTCLTVLLDFPPIGGPPVSDLEDDTTGERSASESLNWTAGSCALKLKSTHLTTFLQGV